ncbi:MAG: hypothetical protein M0Q21_11470 [Ignavibacteriaceae bacterium]|nr:hypothetical protein [Ignavibacteriaceae bacterium]
MSRKLSGNVNIQSFTHSFMLSSFSSHKYSYRFEQNIFAKYLIQSIILGTVSELIYNSIAQELTTQ